jgi:predicted peptidase
MRKRFHFRKTLPLRAEFHCALYLPEGYRSKSRKRWPLLLFLHGSEERGTRLSRVSKHGPPRLVKEGRGFPFILVSPQCPSGRCWSSKRLMALLDEIERKLKVDPGRVYVTGVSMGGYGTWRLAARYPERFAAAAPICGGGDVIEVMLASRSKTAALRKLGVWAFHGARDPIVPVQESHRMVDAFRRAGCAHARLTVYPHAEHDSWTDTYNNPILYEWFLSHQRKPVSR